MLPKNSSLFDNNLKQAQEKSTFSWAFTYIMKSKLFLIFIISSIATPSVFCQPNLDSKSDYAWLFGYESAVINPNSVWFDFNKTPMQIKPIQRGGNGINFTFASICDKNGSLLLYTNGCAILNSNHLTIKNGDTINFGKSFTISCPGGYSAQQGALFLPFPKDMSTFFLLHQFKDTSTNGFIINKNLRLSIIKRINNDFQVSLKDSIILKDTVDAGMTTGCRHANGRDWWIIQHEQYSNRRYKLFLDTNGIRLANEQFIGVPAIKGENGAGQAVFSPDGTKYVRYNFKSDVQIFDFDRCTGNLSNFIHIPIQDFADTMWQAGAAISPNSRFLYIPSSRYVYQFDLKSNNIAASKLIVADWDGTGQNTPYPLLFNMAQLGPDGKIYMSCPNGVEYYHVIHSPDSIGKGCNVEQHIQLPVYIVSSFSGFPNYRLGSIKGSPCDTLTTATTELSIKGKLRIYPNPAQDIVKIDMTVADYNELDTHTLQVVDIVGRVHQMHPLSKFASIKEISVAGLINGLYFVQLVDGRGRVMANNKVVVAH